MGLPQPGVRPKPLILLMGVTTALSAIIYINILILKDFMLSPYSAYKHRREQPAAHRSLPRR